MLEYIAKADATHSNEFPCYSMHQMVNVVGFIEESINLSSVNKPFRTLFFRIYRLNGFRNFYFRRKFVRKANFLYPFSINLWNENLNFREYLKV